METATVLAIVGLVLSGIAIIVAVSQAWSGRRSARAAEASAASSEESAAAAVRSADAAERSVGIQARTLSHEERRAQRELEADEERKAPKLSPVHDHPVGTFNLHKESGRLSAHFVNNGLSPAILTKAELRHLNGTSNGLFRYFEPHPSGEGLQSTLRLSEEARVVIDFEVEPNYVLQGSDAPVLFLTFHSEAGGYQARLQCPLLRSNSDATGRPVWRAGEMKTARLKEEVSQSSTS